MGVRHSNWVVGLATLSSSIGVAVAYLATNHWFGSGDLPAMAIWSLPLAAMVAVLTGGLTRASVAAQAWLRYPLLVALGAVLGFLWTVIAAILLGGWIGAFSFPVLFCWVAAGVTGGITAAWLRQPRGWPVATVLMVAVMLSVARLNAYARAPEPRIRVVVKAGATEAEVQRVWTDVLGRRTGRGDEHKMLDGLSSVAASGTEGNSAVLTVSFRKGTSKKERDRLSALIRQSPLVQRIDSVPASDSSGVRISVSY
jgi:hypothetical protein